MNMWKFYFRIAVVSLFLLAVVNQRSDAGITVRSHDYHAEIRTYSQGQSTLLYVSDFNKSFSVDLNQFGVLGAPHGSPPIIANGAKLEAGVLEVQGFSNSGKYPTGSSVEMVITNIQNTFNTYPYDESVLLASKLHVELEVAAGDMVRISFSNSAMDSRLHTQYRWEYGSYFTEGSYGIDLADVSAPWENLSGPWELGLGASLTIEIFSRGSPGDLR